MFIKLNLFPNPFHNKCSKKLLNKFTVRQKRKIVRATQKILMKNLIKNRKRGIQRLLKDKKHFGGIELFHNNQFLINNNNRLLFLKKKSDLNQKVVKIILLNQKYKVLKI